MDIVKIEKVNLVNEVYKQLRDMILSGNWSEGTKIGSENQLAERFSVSRVVIREAFQLLRSEKLIVTRQGVGTYVANPSNFTKPDRPIALSEGAYRRFLEFRQCVEVSAIELSKANATSEDYARVEEFLQQMRECQEDVKKYSEADFGFHFAIIKCSHNEFLERAMLANKNAIASVFLEMNAVPKAQDFGVKSHEAILQAMRKKDIKSAIKQYTQMSKYNLARMVEFFNDNQPDNQQ